MMHTGPKIIFKNMYIFSSVTAQHNVLFLHHNFSELIH